MRNIKSRTRCVLTAYFYEVQTNIFVGILNFKLYQDILKDLQERVRGKEQALVMRGDKNTARGFSIEYINCFDPRIDFDGIEFFR